MLLWGRTPIDPVAAAIVVVLPHPRHGGRFVGQTIDGGVERPHRRGDPVVEEVPYIADGRGGGAGFDGGSGRQRRGIHDDVLH